MDIIPTYGQLYTASTYSPTPDTASFTAARLPHTANIGDEYEQFARTSREEQYDVLTLVDPEDRDNEANSDYTDLLLNNEIADCFNEIFHRPMYDGDKDSAFSFIDTITSFIADHYAANHNTFPTYPLIRKVEYVVYVLTKLFFQEKAVQQTVLRGITPAEQSALVRAYVEEETARIVARQDVHEHHHNIIHTKVEDELEIFLDEHHRPPTAEDQFLTTIREAIDAALARYDGDSPWGPRSNLPAIIANNVQHEVDMFTVQRGRAPYPAERNDIEEEMSTFRTMYETHYRQWWDSAPPGYEIAKFRATIHENIVRRLAIYQETGGNDDDDDGVVRGRPDLFSRFMQHTPAPQAVYRDTHAHAIEEDQIVRAIATNSPVPAILNQETTLYRAEALLRGNVQAATILAILREWLGRRHVSPALACLAVIHVMLRHSDTIPSFVTVLLDDALRGLIRRVDASAAEAARELSRHDQRRRRGDDEPHLGHS